MNVDFIKSEIAKLSQLVASWSDDANISTIERDMALDKLKALYEHLRFGVEPVDAPAEVGQSSLIGLIPTTDAVGEEKDVEVEFLFAEEDEEDEENRGSEENEDTAIVTAESDDEAEPEEEVFDKAADDNEIGLVEETEDEEPAADEAAPYESSFEKEEVVEDEQEAATEAVEEIKQEEATEEEMPAQNFGNLFGMEEPKRPSRSKHIRMMSIYNDTESTPQTKPAAQEKEIDISKIFDFGIEVEKPVREEPVTTPHTVADSADRNITLADAIAPNTQTLADTIAAPAPLAEEITASKIVSLSDGVGLNDKFLMIRDLFDGDEEAYEQAISDLDAEEDMDGCMVYIAENFEWNPNLEGAKFIMQLLSRKHS